MTNIQNAGSKFWHHRRPVKPSLISGDVPEQHLLIIYLFSFTRAAMICFYYL